MASEVTIRERAAQNLGLWVIVLLAVLTAVEFGIFAAVDATAALILLLIPIALLKAWLILNFFMHVARVWRSEESR